MRSFSIPVALASCARSRSSDATSANTFPYDGDTCIVANTVVTCNGGNAGAGGIGGGARFIGLGMAPHVSAMGTPYTTPATGTAVTVTGSALTANGGAGGGDGGTIVLNGVSVSADGTSTLTALADGGGAGGYVGSPSSATTQTITATILDADNTYDAALDNVP